MKNQKSTLARYSKRSKTTLRCGIKIKGIFKLVNTRNTNFSVWRGRTQIRWQDHHQAEVRWRSIEVNDLPLGVLRYHIRMAETQYHRSAPVSILNPPISTQLNVPDTVVMIAASALPPRDTVVVVPLVAMIPTTPNTVAGPLPPHDTVAVVIGTVPAS